MEGTIQTITLGGTEYVIVPRAEYDRLAGRDVAAGGVPAGAVDAVDLAQRTVAEGLRRAREAAGLTQAELAARLKKSQPMVSGAESGRVRVGAGYVKAVLKACGLPPDWKAPKAAEGKAARRKKS